MEILWIKEILGDSYTEEIGTAISEKIQEEFISKTDFISLEAEKNSLVEKRSILEKQIQDSNKSNAIDMAIFKAKGKNPKAIKALLDLEGIVLKEDGTLDGFNLEELMESDGYLFHTEESKTIGTGFNHGVLGDQKIISEIDNALGIRIGGI